MGMKC